MPQRERERSLDPGSEGDAGIPTLSGRPRVLLAVADPVDLRDYGLAELSGAASSLRGILDASACCDVLEAPVTLARLRRALRSDRYEVFHLVAHGLPPASGAPGLILETRKRRIQKVRNEVLATIFGRAPRVRLVVLVACFSSAGSDDHEGLAGQLIRRGIPATVAMRCEVSLAALSVLAEELYPPLAQTGRVDVAFEEAQEALLAESEADADSLVGLWPNFPDGQIWYPRRLWLYRLRAAALAIPLLMNGPAVSGPVLLQTGPQISTTPSSPPQEIPNSTAHPNQISTTHPAPPVAQRDVIPEIPEEVREKIKEARAHLEAGLYEQGRNAYEEAFNALRASEPEIFRTLDKTRLQDLGEAPLAEEAAHEYARILDPLAEEPSTFNPGDVP